MTASRFVVDDVFTPIHRAGPLVTGHAEEMKIENGTRLVLEGDPSDEVTVLGVEFATENALTEGSLTLVLSSDLAGRIRRGVVLRPS